MTIRYSCSCGSKIKLPDSASGKKARCRKCDHIFIVPEPADPTIQTEPQTGQSPPPLPDSSAPHETATVPTEPDSDHWLDEFAAEESAAPVMPEKPIDREQPDDGLIALADEDDEPDIIAPPSRMAPRIPAGVESAKSQRLDWVTPPEKSFWQDVAATFFFFLDAGNFITCLWLAVLLIIPQFVPPLMCIGPLIGLVIFGYFCAFLMNIILDTAAGQDDLPDIIMDSSWHDAVISILQFFGTWVVVLLPAAVAALVSYRETGAILYALVIPLFVLGLLLWPAVMLSTAIGRGFSGLWPHTIVRTALADPLGYLTICAGVGLAYILISLPTYEPILQQLTNAPAAVTRLIEVASIVLTIYAAVISMRMIGLYYRHFKQKFPWVAE